jgi:hypothetical protein
MRIFKAAAEAAPLSQRPVLAAPASRTVRRDSVMRDPPLRGGSMSLAGSWVGALEASPSES